MDPNIALSRLRRLFAEWEEWGQFDGDMSDTLDEMSDIFFALDNWLTSGGFRPDDWS